MVHSKKHICFFIPYAIGLFDSGSKVPFGGAELRSVNFANGLKSLGFKISFIVFDANQDAVLCYEDIKVYKHSFYQLDEFKPENNKQVKSMPERISAKIRSLLFSDEAIKKYNKEKVLKDVNADLYCSFEISNASLEVLEFCKKKNKKYFHFISSDEELSSTFADSEINRFGRTKNLTASILENSSLVFVQNKFQQLNAKKIFTTESVIIKNPIVIQKKFNSEIKYILWVGKDNEVKQPALFIELAKALPQYQFRMVFNSISQQRRSEIADLKINNLEIASNIPAETIESYFAASCLLISTSLFEGFPNTFLQAGKYGVPVISAEINPDMFITEFNCGKVVSRDMQNLKNATEELMNDSALYNECSRNIMAYVKANHDVAVICQNLAEKFQ